jgi:Peptidase family M48
MGIVSWRASAVVAALTLWATTTSAQTIIKPPKNRYTPKQDVELGREAAAEVRRQYPIIQDERIAHYLTRLGDRLVAAAPSDLNDPVYEYSFTPVNLKEINAFALPGGPMFVHRGMFDAAASEGEVAGVMAHELSHVLLRHGMANASKAQNPWLQLGQVAGMVGGAMVGGQLGSRNWWVPCPRSLVRVRNRLPAPPAHCSVSRSRASTLRTSDRSRAPCRAWIRCSGPRPRRRPQLARRGHFRSLPAPLAEDSRASRPRSRASGSSPSSWRRRYPC